MSGRRVALALVVVAAPAGVAPGCTVDTEPLAGDGTYLPLAGGHVTGAVSVGGRLGVGIATPMAALHVAGQQWLGSTDGTIDNSQLYLGRSQAADQHGIVEYDWAGGAGRQVLRFQHAHRANQFVLAANGSVGVNTGVPEAHLHVMGLVRSDLPSDNTADHFQLGDGAAVWGRLGITGATRHFYLKSPNDVQISAGNAPRMTIKSDGRVGIGTDDPAASLDVVGAVTASLGLGSGSSQLVAARPNSAYLVTISGNYNVGNAVRSGVYHVLINHEATAVVATAPISQLGGMTPPTFSVANGYLVVSDLPAGNNKASVIGN